MNITGFPKEENTITTPTKYIDKNNTTNTNINNNNSSSSSKNKKKHSSSHKKKKKKKKKRKVEKSQAELYRERKEREYEENKQNCIIEFAINTSIVLAFSNKSNASRYKCKSRPQMTKKNYKIHRNH